MQTALGLKRGFCFKPVLKPTNITEITNREGGGARSIDRK